MRKASKKLISLCVAVLFLLALTLPAYAQLSDINGHWAAAQINKWVEKGIITGNTDGTYAPDRAITRAEFATIIGRLFNYVDKSSDTFSDVSPTAAYSEAVSKAAAAGIIIGNQGKFRPTEPISRQEAALIITRAFSLELKDKNAANQFADGKSIPAWSKDAVSAVAVNKCMTGRPGNIFDPTASVTRAEVVKIIDNIVQDLENTAGTYTGTFDKSLVVNTGDVTLKDAVINGDLILAQGIGEGTVTLDNVTVKGRTLALGGGENSIHVNDSQLLGKLLVIKVGGKIRIVAAGTTEIASTQLLSGANLEGDGFGTVEILGEANGDTVVLNGDFDEVVIEVPGVSINVASGTIGKLTVAAAAADTKIQLDSTAKVGTLTADAPLQLTGNGTIDKAVINSSNVNLAVTPKSVEIKDGLTGVVTGTTPTTGGNGGGGGGGGSTVSASAISLIKAGDDIVGTVSGNNATFNLSNKSTYPDSLMITGMSITANPTDSILTITDVTSSNNWDSGDDRDITNLSNITVPQLTGTNIFGNDISLGSLRILFGSTVTVTGTLKHDGWNSRNLSVTINLGEAPEELATQLFDVEVDGRSATATVSNPAILNHKVSGYGITALLTQLIGTDDMPKAISLDEGATWLPVDTAAGRTAAQSAIADECGTTWAALKVEDLVGLQIYAKINASDAESLWYDITIAEP